MMKFIVQTDSISLLREAFESQCNGIRFGAEFCEHKIPNQTQLKQAYEEAVNSGKSFSYVVPILSNIGIEKIRPQLDFLRDLEDVEVIIGDFGALNLLQNDNDLRLRLGRPRVYIPARSPWSQITRLPNPSFFALRKVEKIFYQTNLNYMRSLDYFKDQGITGADVDWIPKCFPQYHKIIKNGFNLAVHTYAVPIAVTMRCHTARFMGETTPTQCSKPCIDKAFNIKQRELQKSFILHGNVIFRQVESQKKDIKQLKKTGIDELIIPMGPVSCINTMREINEAIATLSLGV
jgi:hypothetical protein